MDIKNIKDPHDGIGIAVALGVIGVITYFLSFVAGVVFAMAYNAILSTFICWFGGFIVGTSFLGFSKILHLLRAIYKRLTL